MQNLIGYLRRFWIWYVNLGEAAAWYFCFVVVIPGCWLLVKWLSIKFSDDMQQ